MELICRKCQSKLKINADKLPKGKRASLRCPKCNEAIIIPAQESLATADETVPEEQIGAQEQYSADNSLDILEMQSKTCLVCILDEARHKVILEALKNMGYYPVIAEDTRDGLRKLRAHTFDFVAVDEIFDTKDPNTNSILIYFERLNMSQRRNTFITLFSDRYQTMDRMAQFQRSVSLIVHNSHVNEFENILKRGQKDTAVLYRVFIESMKAAGRL